MSDNVTDSEKLADMVFESVKVYVERFTLKAITEGLAPIVAQIATLEKSIAAAPAPLTAEQVKAAVDEAVAAIEVVVPDPIPGEKGADGVDGKDAVVDYESINARVAELVAERRAATEAGLEVWAAGLIDARVKAAVAEIPKPTDGRDGRDGKQGEPGRDATEVYIASAIEPDRVYSMGAWARHRGGIWRALRDTDPLSKCADATAAGWTTMVDGVADTSDVMEDDGRTLTRTTELSSGRKSVTTFEVPAMIYRGLYELGKEYRKGDVVTFAGSMLLAQRTTTAIPETPAAGDDWRVAVKRGRDGKDYKPTAEPSREPLSLR